MLLLLLRHDKLAVHCLLIGSSSNAINLHEVERKEHSSTLKKLEEQYESSRYLTHVARGVGLGFGSTAEQHEDVTEK